MAKAWVRETEGEGYVSGDRECWCIHPWPFEEWQRVWNEYHGRVDEHDGDYDAVEEPSRSTYPSDLFPEGQSFVIDRDGVDYSKKVRYKGRVEVEEIGDED